MGTEKTWREEFETSGEDLLAKVRGVIHEGNVQRVILRRDGKTLIEVPLTAGVTMTVLTAAMAPALVAIGAVAAVVSQVTLVVERVSADSDTEAPDEATILQPDDTGARNR